MVFLELKVEPRLVFNDLLDHETNEINNSLLYCTEDWDSYLFNCEKIEINWASNSRRFQEIADFLMSMKHFISIVMLIVKTDKTSFHDVKIIAVFAVFHDYLNGGHLQKWKIFS